MANVPAAGSGAIALVFAVTCVVPAQAQDTKSPAANPAIVEQPTSGNIIVTAQRRSERLTDVPIAIVAQSAEQLDRAGVTNARDLTIVTPGLRFSGNGANAQPAIRGVHSDQTDPGNDANVALYLDGVYQSNQIANNMDLADVERVEVLKGPQGTLFGRNATGGAIRIFTRQPSFTPAGILDVSYGSFSDITAKAYLSGPIVGDVVAASLSGGYEHSDSYARDLSTGKRQVGIDSKTVRGKLLIRPTDTLDITLTGAYLNRVDGNATSYQPLNGNTVASLFPGAVYSNQPYNFASNPKAQTKAKVYMGSAKVEWRLGTLGTLSSLTAYNDVDVSYNTDADLSSLPLLQYPISEKQRDLSEELTFASEKFGIFQFTAGAFYYDSVGRYDPLIVQGSFVSPTLYGYQRQATKAVAAFGELNITPTEHLSFILGARYSHERRNASGSFYLVPGRPANLPFLGAASFNSVTPRATARYKFDSGDNVYFTFSRGFKSGGFNLAGLSTEAYNPEKIDAYEVGLKTSPRRALAANLSTFLYKYKDQQVSSNVNGFNVTANAASSRIWGMDADIVIRPAPEFTATIGAAYLHARFQQYANAVFNVPTVVGGATCFCGNDTVIGDLSGGIEPYSPTFTIGITTNYRKALAFGTIDLSASLYSTSRFFYDNNARIQQPAYSTAAARAAFTPTGFPVTLYIWAKNLTDTRYFNTTFISNAGDGVTYAAPRTVGAGARLEF
jgi:iron complex outermembrane receptor protein